MKTALSIDPPRAALLCVDLQEEHRGDRRYLVENFDLVLANVRRLQDAARKVGIPVLHSAYVVEPSSSKAAAFHPFMADGRSAFSDAGDPLTAICAEAAPAAGELVMQKSVASSFSDPQLADTLHRLATEWLVMAGVWTEACIAATVRDAIANGYRVLLVKDACGSGTAAMHETAILNLANRLYGGAVADTSAACRLLAGETVAAWRVDGAVPIRFTYENASDFYRSL